MSLGRQLPGVNGKKVTLYLPRSKRRSGLLTLATSTSHAQMAPRLVSCVHLPSCKSSTATSWKSCRSTSFAVPASEAWCRNGIKNRQADMARCDQSSLLRVGQSCHHSITSAERRSQYFSLPCHCLVTKCPRGMQHCILRFSCTLEASEVANN